MLAKRQYDAASFRAAVGVLRDTALDSTIQTGFADEAGAIQQLGKGCALIKIC